MDFGTFQPLLDWVAGHPVLAQAVVFAIAAGESLALVGVLIPGVALMLAIGALVGLGSMDLWPTLAWAAAGAIAGDGLSYWLGRRFHEQLRQIWPLSRYPDLIPRGEAFFRRHGAKSVLFGRFFGPVRAVIPAVAGILNMPPSHFFLVNVLSALAWAPVVILPGVAFGASLGLASEIASRLVLLIVILIGLLWLVVWSVRRLYKFLHPRAEVMIERILLWSQSYRVLAPIVSAVVDPKQPEIRGLLEFGLILIIAVWSFIVVLKAVITTESFLYFDHLVSNFMQDLRTPWADHLMLLFVDLSQFQVAVSASLLMTSWFLLARNWKAIAHWLAANTYGILVPLVLNYTIQLPITQFQFNDANEVPLHNFPNIEVTLTTVVFGFLAVVIAREVSEQRRWLSYAAASMFVALVALSRIYLGIDTLSSILGGITLAAAWVAVLGIAYRRHVEKTNSYRKLIAVSLIVPAIVIIWFVIQPQDKYLQRYALAYPEYNMNDRGWWQHDWRDFPVYRMDLGKKQEYPLTIQWAGQLNKLKELLIHNGWHPPIPLTFTSGLLWLTPNPELNQLPILPQVHEGRHSSLLLVKETGSPDQLLVLRLWPTGAILSHSKLKVWIGNITYLRLIHRWDLFVYPRTELEFNQPLRIFASSIGQTPHEVVERNLAQGKHQTDHVHWNGTVLLVAEKPIDEAD